MNHLKFLLVGLAGSVFILLVSIFNAPLPEKISSILPPISSQLAQVVSSNLVAHYTFDDGTAADVSGNGNNGTVTGATATVGNVGAAMSFNGASTVISAGPVPGAQNISELSVSAWFKASVADSTNAMVIVGKSDGTSFTSGWTLWRTASELMRFSVGNGTVAVRAESSAFPDTNWHHLVGVYDGSTVRIYVDGVQNGTTPSLSGSLGSIAQNLCVGNSAGSVNCAVGGSAATNGLIDDVRVYNRAISSAEVSQLFALGGTGSAPTGGGSNPPPPPPPPETPSSSFTLTVNKAGAGQGTVSGIGINCGSDCSETTTQSGSTYSLTAVPAAGSNFVSWSGCGTTNGATCSGNLNGAIAVTATFDTAPVQQPTTFLLTVNKTGNGTVTGTGINCGSDCSETTSSVTLSATADPDYSFTGWSGGGCSGTGTCPLTLTAATTITANFTAAAAPVVDIPGNGTPGGSSSWQPPYGIPMPPFGIRESHTMYAGQTFAAGNFPYRNAGNGPYTHYVDNSVTCSDTNAGGYGTAAAPRCTLPPIVPEGSVVEIHGGPYVADNNNVAPCNTSQNIWGRTCANGGIHIGGRGTAASPIFYRGTGPANMPVMGNGNFLHQVSPYGSYVIVEYLDFNGGRLVMRNDTYQTTADHLSFRHLIFHGDNAQHGAGATVAFAQTRVPTEYEVNDIVVWDNLIHDYGLYAQGTTEDDWDAIHHNRYDVHRVWSVDNTIYHVGGDAFGLGGNDIGGHDSSYAYVGRNKMYENGENGVDIKMIHHVVVSGNVMHDFHASNSDPGACNVVHYGPDDIWFINNEMYNCTRGINSTGVVDLYVIGNFIHDVSTRGIYFYGGGDIYVANNTVTRSGNGIAQGGSANIRVFANNLISDILPGGLHLDIPQSNPGADFRNNLFYQNGGFRLSWGTSPVTTMPNSCINCLSSNPLLNSNYTLGSGSPAIDRGVSLSSLTTNLTSLFQSLHGASLAGDFNGVARPQGNAWDIGALESGGSASVPPPTPTDQTNPTISITAPVANATLIGSAVTITASASDNVAVTGVQFKVDGVNRGTEDISSPYSVPLDTTTLTNGTHTISATARDAAGNIGISATITVTVSNDIVVAPPIPVISSIALTAVSQNSATITFTTDQDTISAIDYGLSTSYGSTAAYTTSFIKNHSRTLSALQSGTTYHYRIRTQNSAAGTTQTSDGFFTTQAVPQPEATTTPPALPAPAISGIALGAVTPTTAIITFTTDQDAVSSIDFGETTSYGSIVAFTNAYLTNHMRALANLLPDTTYHYRIRVRNEAGLVTQTNDGTLNTPSAPDITLPTVSFVAPTNNATVAGTIAVTASASDNVTVAGVQLRVDGTLLADDTTSPYSVNLNTLALTDGPHTLTAIARDAEGNSRTATLNIVVANPQLTPADTAAPSIPANLQIISIFPEKVKFSWRASTDNIAVTGYNIYRNGVKIDSTVAINYEDITVSPQTTYSYTVRAYDLLNNLSAPSSPLSITTFAVVAPPVPTIPTIVNIPVVTGPVTKVPTPQPATKSSVQIPQSQTPVSQTPVTGVVSQTPVNVPVEPAPQAPIYKIVQKENEIPVPLSIDPEALYRLQSLKLPPISTTLKLGMTSPDVVTLQKTLNALGFIVAVKGSGSPGKETDYFDSATAEAVKKFRAAYYDTPVSPTATGEVNDLTRYTINSLIQGTTIKVTAEVPSTSTSFSGWIMQYFINFFNRIKEGFHILRP